MLVIPSNFQTAITNKETNKIIFVKLFYNDTEYTGFASKTIIIDDNLCFGSIVNYSPTKSTWNWLSDNTVTITTPALTISNIELPSGYRFIDDIYNNNYFGKNCQIYIAYEKYSTTTDDMIKIFDGTIDDIEFNMNSNDISIVLKSQNLPKSEIQGRLVDYKLGTIGSITSSISSILGIDSEPKYLPIAFGRQLFAPTICISNGARYYNPYYDKWTYCACDYYTVSSNPAITATVSASEYKFKQLFRGANNERDLLTIQDNNFYVPINKIDWENFYGIKVYSITGNNYGLLNAQFKIAVSADRAFDNYPNPYIYNEDTVFHNYFINRIPMRFYTSPYGDGSTIGTRLSGNWYGATGHLGIGTSTLSGNWRNIFNNNYWGDGNSVSAHINNSSIFITLWGNQFYPNYRSEVYDDDNFIIFKNRKMHINSNEDGREASLFIKSTSYNSDWYSGNYNRNLKFGYNAINTSDDAVNEGFVDDGLYTISHLNKNVVPPTWELAKWGIDKDWSTNDSNEMWYPVVDGENSANQNTGTMALSNSNSYWDFINDEDYQSSSAYDLYKDNWGITREYAQYANQFNFIFTNYGYPSTHAYYKFDKISLQFFQQRQEFTYNNINLATNGISLGLGQLLSNTGSSNLYRPYHYLETMLRYASSANNSNFSSNWTASAIDNKWENLNDDWRDYSGFSIIEKTNFDNFVKEYTKYEPFTIYKNEEGKYDIICFKESYELSDVQYTIDFNSCNSFQISMSDLDSVCWKINNLSNEYNSGINDYSIKNEYKIADSSYSISYYGEDSERFVIENIEKKYTSQSKPEGVNYAGNSYHIKQSHISRDGQVPSSYPLVTEFAYDNYTPAPSYDSTYPTWIANTKYSQNGTEGIAIAKYILNQFGNRHRIVKLSSPNYELFKLQIGDIIKFSNVPYKCLGLEFSGWNGNTSTNYIDNVNGQRVYSYFMISSITKYQDKIDIECFNIHRLDDFDIETTEVSYKSSPKTGQQPMYPEYGVIR